MNDPPASSRISPAVSIEPVADDTPVKARPVVLVETELVPCTETVVLVRDPDVSEVAGVDELTDDGLVEAEVGLDDVPSVVVDSAVVDSAVVDSLVVDSLLEVGRTESVVPVTELDVADMSMVVLVEAELVVDSEVDVDGVLVVSLDSVVEGVLVVSLDSVVEGVLVVSLDSVVEVLLESVVLESVVLESVVLESVVLESVVLDSVLLESVLDDGVDFLVVDLLVFVQPQSGS